MSPEGREQALKAGVDVDDPVQRASWRVRCMQGVGGTGRFDEVDRPYDPAKYQRMFEGLMMVSRREQ